MVTFIEWVEQKGEAYINWCGRGPLYDFLCMLDQERIAEWDILMEQWPPDVMFRDRVQILWQQYLTEKETLRNEKYSVKDKTVQSRYPLPELDFPLNSPVAIKRAMELQDEQFEKYKRERLSAKPSRTVYDYAVRLQKTGCKCLDCQEHTAWRM